jgi:hypothetical protein
LQPLERCTSQRDFLGGEVREILSRQARDIAPRLQSATGGIFRRGVAAHLLPSRCRTGRRRRDGIVASTVRDVAMTSAPEQLEGAVERRQVLVPMHQQRPAGMVDVIARAEVDVLQRLADVQHASHVDLEAQRSQQPPEDEQIGQEL